MENSEDPGSSTLATLHSPLNIPLHYDFIRTFRLFFYTLCSCPVPLSWYWMLDQFIYPLAPTSPQVSFERLRFYSLICLLSLNHHCTSFAAKLTQKIG